MKNRKNSASAVMSTLFSPLIIELVRTRALVLPARLPSPYS